MIATSGSVLFDGEIRWEWHFDGRLSAHFASLLLNPAGNICCSTIVMASMDRVAASNLLFIEFPPALDFLV